jgi:hypothetical protein
LSSHCGQMWECGTGDVLTSISEFSAHNQRRATQRGLALRAPSQSPAPISPSAAALLQTPSGSAGQKRPAGEAPPLKAGVLPMPQGSAAARQNRASLTFASGNPYE